MTLAKLIEELSNPGAYSHPIGPAIEVRQTHISVVFLAGSYAYKLKKPVDLGFLDFSTLAKRYHFCQEEVRLNRRLAPEVYLGVVPVVQTAKGMQFEGEGEVVEWAVKMLRLSDDTTMQERLRLGQVSLELVKSLAGKVAAFHRTAEANERIASFGRFEAVARIILDIFAQGLPQVGNTVSEAVFRRVKGLAEQGLAQLRPLIEARSRTGHDA